jgi:glucose-6-phosphate isomerase
MPRCVGPSPPCRSWREGALANPDEGRMVGHYWLRAPELAPDPPSRRRSAPRSPAILAFPGRCTGVAGSGTTSSSASADRRWGPSSWPRPWGAGRTGCDPTSWTTPIPMGSPAPGEAGRDLAGTLTIVVSKSGGTPETRNGMLEAAGGVSGAEPRLRKARLRRDPGGERPRPHREGAGFLARFPMWDWVGGRTSSSPRSASCPAALQGIDVAPCSRERPPWTAPRAKEIRAQPCRLLALSWHHATEGVGRSDMVVLPYKDRSRSSAATSSSS